LLNGTHLLADPFVALFPNEISPRLRCDCFSGRLREKSVEPIRIEHSQFNPAHENRPERYGLTTTIPARLERLPWGEFHTLVVVALGITWILDGMEVTLAGWIAGALQSSPVLKFSGSDVGIPGSAYLLGAVTGGLLFGWLTDRLGRKESSSSPSPFI
jgi:hypothetical protein